MHRVYLLTFVTLLICNSFLFGQGQKPIEIQKVMTTSIAELLIQLKTDHDLSFIYSNSVLPNDLIRIEPNIYSLDELLKLVSNQANVQFKFSGNDVLVLLSPPKVTLSGYVRDASNGEALIGATIRVMDSKAGVISNDYGYFALPVSPGKYRIEVSYIGYVSKTDSLVLTASLKRDYSLDFQTQRLNELTFYSYRPIDKIESPMGGNHLLTYQEGSQIPYFMGEVDILQEALLLPGIKTIGEDASGLNIRGGGIDQNLVMLDEAVIYNPNHFFGLISVFNPEAVNRVQIMKGFTHPQFGGRASSVINVVQKDGNNQDFKVSGGVGLVSARVLAEGPIKKEVSSFLFSARQSLLDLSLDGGNLTQSGDSRTSFRDVNIKINLKPSARNSYFLSGYLGNDRNRTGFNTIRNWGNRTLTARWNHTYKKQWFSHVSAVVSSYNYRITDPVEVASFIGKSNVNNYSLKLDNEYYINPSNMFQFGIQTSLHQLKPGERLPFDENSSFKDTLLLPTERAIEYAAYLSHETDIGNKLKLLYGLRFSGLNRFGPGVTYRYDPALSFSDISITDTIRYKNGQTIFNSSGLEPRFSLNWMPRKNQSVKLSYSRTIQYIHLISNTAAPAPTDTWKLSDRYIPPNINNQISIGYFHHFKSGIWQLGTELYFKKLSGLIDYKDGSDLLFNDNPETEILIGNGRAYGMEIMIEKPAGSLHGWISYTLSKTERKTVGNFGGEAINNGKFYPENHDKPHQLNTVIIYEPTRLWQFSTTFSFASGRPITFPTGKYEFNGIVVPHFEGRNRDRISDYHRLDLSIRKLGSTLNRKGDLKHYKDFWTLSVYNVYARKNAYSYFFRQSESDPTITEVVRFSIFDRVIPSLTYNFKF